MCIIVVITSTNHVEVQITASPCRHDSEELLSEVCKLVVCLVQKQEEGVLSEPRCNCVFSCM